MSQDAQRINAVTPEISVRRTLMGGFYICCTPFVDHAVPEWRTPHMDSRVIEKCIDYFNE
jgi:hypothetical protein